MGKFFYIKLIFFVCLTINSCADYEKSSESSNSKFTEQKWFSEYDILIGTALLNSENLFSPKQTSAEKSKNSVPQINNIILVKHNSSGNREWILDLGMSDDESEISMTFDSSDNVYITVYRRIGLEGNKNSNDFRVLLVKYNSSGSREWIKNLGNSEVEYGARMIVDSSDNVYVTGFSSEFELYNEFVPRNTLLAKFDTSGNREWIKSLGSNLTEFTWDITVDSMDKIYVTGLSEDSFFQNTSLQDKILQMKFNTDGIQL